MTTSPLPAHITEQGLSCTSTPRALQGVCWGGTVLCSSSPSPGELAAQRASCCPLPTAPGGSCLFRWCLEIAPCLVTLAASPADRESGAPAAARLLRMADDKLLPQTDRQTDGTARGSAGIRDSDTLHRRGSLRLEKQKQCCFQTKEVYVTHQIHNLSALSSCHWPVSSRLWPSRHRAHLLLAPGPHRASQVTKGLASSLQGPESTQVSKHESEW